MPWLRKRENVVPHAVVRLPLDRKTFFAALDVVRQRAVRKSKTSLFVDHVNNATRVQRPHATRSRFDRNDCTFLNPHAVRHKRHPAKLKMPPLLQRFNRPSISLTTVAQLNTIVIECVTGGTRGVDVGSRSADFRITERKLYLAGDVPGDISIGRLGESKHQLSLRARG